MKTKNTILLNRSILTWGWYKDTNTSRLFIHLLLRVNWEDRYVNGILIKRGQVLTSIDSLRYETGMTVSQIRTALNKLTMTSEITSKSTNKYRIITVLKYNEYQYSNKQVDKQDSKQIANKIAPNNKDNLLNQSNPLNPLIKDVVDFLNKKLGSNYKPQTKGTKKDITARINEGYELEDFKTVINKKYDEWNNTEWAKHLVPSTLFGNKFEGYLNQVDTKSKRADISNIKDDYHTPIGDEWATKGPFREGSN